jgi:hypothetical protein
MNTTRKKPEFGKTDSAQTRSESADDPMSCVLMPIGVVVSYFVLSAIAGVIFDSASKLDEIICYAALICFLVLMLRGVCSMYQDSRAKVAERARWAEGCTTAVLIIVGRQKAASWWSDYYNRYLRVRNSLRLEMNSDQKAALPNYKTVDVEVSQRVYDRLEERNSVRIHYVPESPLTFLLEEEL